MKKRLFSIVALFAIANANGCLLTQSDKPIVTWSAYKTFAKLGVAGEFTDINYQPNRKEGKNFKELFVGSKVSIDISKISTKNEVRDKRLVEMFFNKLKGKKIDATIKDIRADKPINGKRVYHGTVDVLINMNEKSIVIPMRYNYHNKDGEFKAVGTIDLFDFNAKDALNSINKSCYELHKGKTWNDVTIEFTTTVKASLCDVKIDSKSRDINESKRDKADSK